MGIFDNRRGSESGNRRPARYSALGLLHHGLTGSDWQRAWHAHDLEDSYDVVIVGGGVHGLATAYYLAKEHAAKAPQGTAAQGGPPWPLE